MPAKSDSNLFDLIKSLSKKEKAELDKKFFHDKKDTAYFKIYQFIDKKQDIYDEGEVLKACGIDSKKFPGIKNYLYNLIIFELEIIHSEEIENVTISRSISKIYVLMNKGLFRQSLKIAEKFIEKAYKREDYLALIQLIEIRDIIKSRFTGELSEEKIIQKNFDEILSAYDNLFDVIYFKYHLFKAILPVMQGNKFHELNISKPFREPITNTFLKKVVYHRYQSRKALSERDYKNVLKHNDELLGLIKKKADSATIPHSWIIGIYNTRLSLLINTGKYSEAMSFLPVSEKTVEAGGETEENKLDEMIFRSMQLSLLCIVGKFADMINIGDLFFEGKYNKTRLETPELNITCLYYMAYAYFGKGDLKNCLKYINELLSLSKSEIVRVDYHAKTLMLEILVYLEKEEYDFVLSSLLRAYQRLLKQNELNNETETIIYNYLREIAQRQGKNTKIIYEKWHAELSASFNDYNYYNFAKYFDILAWIESKIKSVDFSIIARKRLN